MDPACNVTLDAEILLQVPEDRREVARGVELLLAATLVHSYCADDEDADVEPLAVSTIRHAARYRQLT